MKILITGNNGFIGKALVQRLANDNDITGIDISNCDNNDIEYINHDLTQSNHKVEAKIKECDIVIHLAGPVGIERIDYEHTTYLADMLLINLNIFNLIKKYNKKVIFTSTSEVYFETKYANETDNLIIGSPVKSRWGYASGKLTSEFLCKSLCKNNIILRLFNVTGKGDNKGVAYKMSSAIAKNNNITLYGSGNQVRTLCDIRDAVEFIYHLIQNDIYDGDVYNVGNEKNTISMLYLAKCFIKLSSKNVNIQYKQIEDVFSKNHADIEYRKPCCNKMEKIYKPRYDVQDIIQSML